MKKRLRKKLYKGEYKDPAIRTKLHVMLAPIMKELAELHVGADETKLIK